MNLKIFHVVAFSIIVTTSFFCAGQVSPTGGPPDKTPPEILETYPLPGATQYNDSKIGLQFSKYVDRRSVEESIFISPVVGELAFEWGGTDVEIRFPGTLRKNTTYILTVGTDVIDTRERNRMSKSFALPFSTGDRIDSGMISGRIFDAKPEGVMVFAYSIDAIARDTLNPTHVQPDYLTQSGKDGSFVLPYLSLGSYRVIAVRDEFKNLVYDRQIDQYGVWISDVVLSDSQHSVSGLQFRMTSEDTTSPFLSSIRAIDNSHVLFRFSEKMNKSKLHDGSLMIADTISGTALPVKDFSFTDDDAIEAQAVTANQESLKVYRILLNGAEDISGNRIRTGSNIGLFNGSAQKDTVKPFIKAISVTDSIKNIPIDDTIHFIFNEPVQRKSFESGLHLVDSSGQDAGVVLRWEGSSILSLFPQHSYLWNSWYTLNFRFDSVVDYAGNRGRDSLVSKHFRTINERSLGSIKGTVVNNKPGMPGKIYLWATEVGGNNPRKQSIVLEKPGPFAFDKLFEGKHSLFAFQDEDNNAVYTYGSVMPFTPSEPFAVYSDTIKVRARWPLEGVTIRFK